MKTHKRNGSHRTEHVADHAKALVAATSHIAEQKVADARDRLAAIIDEAKEGVEYIEEKAIEGAKEADAFVRNKPYQAVGLAIGVGALIGFCFARRK